MKKIVTKWIEVGSVEDVIEKLSKYVGMNASVNIEYDGSSEIEVTYEIEEKEFFKEVPLGAALEIKNNTDGVMTIKKIIARAEDKPELSEFMLLSRHRPPIIMSLPEDEARAFMEMYKD